MADKDDDKKVPPKPVARYTVGGDKNKPATSTPKPVPQPVNRYTVGGNKPATPKPAPRPVSQIPSGMGGPVKPRVAPSVRAAQHRAKVNARPMPPPPQRRVIRRAAVGAAAVGVGAAAASSANKPIAPEMQAKVDAIESRFDAQATEAQLGAIYDAIGRIDSKLTDLPFELEKLRTRGYVHSGQLEDKLEALDDTWDDDIRPRVEANLKEQVARLDKELDQAESTVSRMNPRVDSSIQAAETAVDNLERRVDGAHDAVDNLYEGIEDEVNEVERRINDARKMLDLLDASPAIKLREAEGPLLAVEAEWQKDGKEGPNGYLFLTDLRLIFEQREEVVTKKKFGLFKADSEMLQEVHVDVEVHQIESVTHKEEGGFLGVGKADILELIFDASANMSRARFHLKGQNSSEWAVMIKRVQTGEIDADRSDEYVEELEATGIVSASFPTQCPTCYAPIPEQPRGVTSYTCEFCGAVVAPES